MVVSTKSKDVMNTEMHFSTPIYRIEKPEFLNNAIKATDKFIKDSYDRNKEKLKERMMTIKINRIDETN